MNKKISQLKTFFRISNAAFDFANVIQKEFSGVAKITEMQLLHRLALEEIELESPSLQVIDNLLAKIEQLASNSARLSKDLNWTEPKEPTQGISCYNHVACETPLGMALIEWKGWKLSDRYSITIGGDYIGDGIDIDDAKRIVKDWLVNKYKELSLFLEL